MNMLKEISSGVYQISGKRSNIFLLAGEELTLVDTGMPGDDKIIFNTIKEIGRNPDEIKYILITHAHMDHIGSLASVKKISGAKIVANKLETDYIEGREKMWTMERQGLGGKIFKTIMFFMENFVWKYEPVKVDMPCSGGETINSFSGIQVVATPGHSNGSLCYYQKNKGLLFVGDALSTIPKLRTPLKAGCSDYSKALASVKKLGELSFNICFCGHGEPVRSNADTMIRSISSI